MIDETESRQLLEGTTVFLLYRADYGRLVNYTLPTCNSSDGLLPHAASSGGNYLVVKLLIEQDCWLMLLCEFFCALFELVFGMRGRK
jgi:hypothetical protein